MTYARQGYNFFKVYFIGQINTNDIFKDVIKALNRERGATDL